MTYTAQDMLESLEEMKAQGADLKEIVLVMVDKYGDFIYGGLLVNFVEVNEAHGPCCEKLSEKYTVMSIGLPKAGSW